MSPFHCGKFKKHFQSQFRVSGMCHFWVWNDPFALNKFVLVKTIIITIIYLLALFIVHTKTVYTPFLVSKWSHFFGKNYEHYFHIPTGPFYGEKFLKTSYSGSRVLRMEHFLGHKWLICNNENFFQKTC